MTKFIVIYGINNIGKTTQAKNLAKHLKAKYFKAPNYELPSGIKINKIFKN